MNLGRFCLTFGDFYPIILIGTFFNYEYYLVVGRLNSKRNGRNLI